MANNNFVFFGSGADQRSDSDIADADTLGRKGANLLAMHKAGLPVPPGFILPVSVGQDVADCGSVSKETMQAVREGLDWLSQITGRTFGDPDDPLLVSVRSGAAVSMPGMMDTVLNVGLFEGAVAGLTDRSGDPRFAWDTYRRFIQNFGSIVLGVEREEFEMILEDLRASHDCESDAELPLKALQESAGIFQDCIGELAEMPFSSDPFDHVESALVAVFDSWKTPRAERYRTINKIEDVGGSAAIIQAMVFGNHPERSCTGVCFTRNPSTGAKRPFGEWLPNAQGEDVVSGFHTPNELTEAGRRDALSSAPSMERTMPDQFAELMQVGNALEAQFRDMQEIEFTVEQGKLWLLQTRTGKRTDKASLHIAVCLAEEGIISREEALARCGAELIDPMLVSRARPKPSDKPLAKGLPAVPGAVCAEVVFSSDRAADAQKQARAVILMRPETDPKDAHGMNAAVGIITSRGGMTSHAAVVARGMNKPCITAANGLTIELEKALARVGEVVINEGDVITMDGATGQLWFGEIELETPEPDGDLAKLLAWKEQASGS